MTKYKIVKYGDNILREKLKPVDFKQLEPALAELTADMFAILEETKGVGLAANQIGLPHRMFVLLIPGKTEADESKSYVVINPKITKKEGCVTDEEGCLSLPGLWVEVERAKEVTVEYTNEKGEAVTLRARGLLAKALQHETDHLDGKLFIDAANPKLKPQIKKALKQLSKKW